MLKLDPFLSQDLTNEKGMEMNFTFVTSLLSGPTWGRLNFCHFFALVGFGFGFGSFFFWSLSLSLASLKKPSVCYVPGWGFAHIQRWARFPKIVKSKVQKALGFPNRVFQSCHPQPKLSLNLVIQIVTVQARIYTGFHRWNWNWWDFHDKYNKAFN